MKQVITKRNLARAAMTLLVMLCSLTGAWADEFTVYDYGEATSGNVPVEGYWADAYQKCEFVIPQGELTAMAGSAITQMTFYLSTPASAVWGGNFVVFMKEVSETAISAYSGMDDATIVYEGPLDGTQSTMTIEFADSYVYNGGNLLVGVYQTVPGSYKSAKFVGVEVAGASIQGHSQNGLDDVSANQQNFIPKTTFTYGAAPTVTKPKNVTINYTGGLTAEVTWTGEADTYNIDVNGTVTENVTSPYTLEGLTLSTTYTVKVQAKKGSDVSDWTNPVSFTTPACLGGHLIEYTLNDSYGDGWNGNAINIIDACGNVETLTIGSGSTSSGILNLCGDYYQFVWQTGTYASETSFTLIDNGATLYSGQSGSSLTDGQVLHTIGTAPTMLSQPTDLAAGTPGSQSVELSWTENGEATAWEICINDDEENLIATNSNPFTLDQLTPGTDYSVKVRATDGTNVSCWTDAISFTTPETSPKPTDVTASNITANSADISWTGNDDATSYNLRYRTTLGDVVFLENFEGVDNNALPDGWTTIDADGDGQNWFTFTPNDTNDGYGNPYVFDATCATSASYNSNSGALTPDNWLITPKLDLQGTMSVWLRGQDPGYAKEHFAIYLSTSGNSVADFTTTLVPETEATGVYVEYNADLSAFEGQQGYIAIRHFNCTDMFRLNVDNFTITDWTYGEWVTVNNATSPYSLTGLAENSMYQVQVQAVYAEGESQWAAANFTTLEKVPTPADLAASEIKARTAVLSWTENGEATAWEICLNDDEENLIAADSNPFTLTELTPETAYTAKVRAINGEDKSKWSAATSFTTDIANPAPTAVAATHILATAADISWTADEYATGAELQYAEPVYGGTATLAYDDGVQSTGIGTGSESTLTWGVMYPASMITGNTLNSVSMYELASYNTGDITITIYQDGDSAPETQIYTETVSPAGEDGYHQVTFDSPVTITPGKNLWIVLTETGTYQMIGSSSSASEPNATWLENGGSWLHITDLADFNCGWMIRADINSFDLDAMAWTTVSNASSPCQVTGLTPETGYVARVKSLFEDNLESAWNWTYFTTNNLLELADAATDNGETIDTYGGWTFNVKLAGRTLYKDGKWNTICLPFNVTLEGSVLDGAKARELTDANISGSTLNLTFGAEVSELVAGTPYLIRWTDGENIVDPVFEGVTIVANADNSFDSGSGETRVRFLGTYDAMSFSDADNESVLLMGGENKLRYANGNAGLGACRAYFKIGDDMNGARRLTAFHMNLGDETTGIRSIENEPLMMDNDDAWYSLDGRRLEGKPAMKGVYINKGHKITIK